VVRMLIGRNFVAIVAICMIAWVGGSCGKDKGQAESPKAEKDQGTEKQTSIADLARQAKAALTIDDDFLEGRRLVEAAGFIVKSYAEFPVEEVSIKGRVLVYTDKRKKQSGGVVYLKKIGAEVAPAWHWYFEDMVPDSVVNREINRDGLWDVRIVPSRGKALEFVQDDSFTLFAKPRTDWVAMNGACSPPLSGEFALWKCFDGDTTTSWKSSVSSGAFVELPVPFGVTGGILSLTTLPSEQPDRCVVYADGNRVGEVEIQPVVGQQKISLGAGVTGAKKVRLEFPTVRGGGDVVAIAELGLK